MSRLLRKIDREAKATDQRVGQVIWNAIQSHSAASVFCISDKDLEFCVDKARERRLGGERP